MRPVERQLSVVIAIPCGEGALIFIPRPVPLPLRFQHARRCGVTEHAGDWDGPIRYSRAAIRGGCRAPVAQSFLALADPEGRDPRVIASWKLRDVRLVAIARARVLQPLEIQRGQRRQRPTLVPALPS